MKPLTQLRTGMVFAAFSILASIPALAADYETPGGMMAADFVSPTLLQGPFHQVDPTVELSGGFPQFTVRSQYGTWQVLGREMLEIRLSELPAFDQLDRLSKKDEFKKSAGQALAKPIEAVGDLVTKPGETVSNVASGIGLIASRIGHLAGSAATRVGDTVSGDTAKQSGILKQTMTDGVAQPRSFVGDPLGYNAKRREWANQLKVDPYTNSALLSDKLDEFARVSFAGGFPIDATIGMVAAPLSYSVEFNLAGQLEAYQYPAIDIEMRNTERLKKMGIEGLPVRNLTRNKYFTPTLQTALVLALESLGNVSGRQEVVQMATRAASDIEARYLINSLAMLSRYNTSSTKLTTLRGADNVIAASAVDGMLIVPVPMDYLPWVKPVEDFARRQDMDAKQRMLLVSGQASTQATEQLAKQGWMVQANYMRAD